jgi:hypothetical protein
MAAEGGAATPKVKKSAKSTKSMADKANANGDGGERKRRRLAKQQHEVTQDPRFAHIVTDKRFKVCAFGEHTSPHHTSLVTPCTAHHPPSLRAV